MCFVSNCKVDSGFNFPFGTTGKRKTSRVAAALKSDVKKRHFLGSTMSNVWEKRPLAVTPGRTVESDASALVLMLYIPHFFHIETSTTVSKYISIDIYFEIKGCSEKKRGNREQLNCPMAGGAFVAPPAIFDVI